jgi:hypothetical protein
MVMLCSHAHPGACWVLEFTVTLQFLNCCSIQYTRWS